MAERFKAPVLKTGVGASPPWVRIPLPPPHAFNFISFYWPNSSHPYLIPTFAGGSTLTTTDTGEQIRCCAPCGIGLESIAVLRSNMSESSAIRHSIARLEKARAALASLESANTLGEAESAWSDLLLAANGIYSKLEQGSKTSGRAEGWFGRAKRARKDDPLLSYMHHARNSEEHAIEDVTVRLEVGQATITVRQPYDPLKLDGVQISVGTDSSGHVRVTSSNEDLISTKMYDKPSLALVRVKDSRYKDVFDPPSEHLGARLADPTPLKVGKLFVDYMTKLIEDAKSFGV